MELVTSSYYVQDAEREASPSVRGAVARSPGAREAQIHSAAAKTDKWLDEKPAGLVTRWLE